MRKIKYINLYELINNIDKLALICVKNGFGDNYNRIFLEQSLTQYKKHKNLDTFRHLFFYVLKCFNKKTQNDILCYLEQDITNLILDLYRQITKKKSNEIDFLTEVQTILIKNENCTTIIEGLKLASKSFYPPYGQIYQIIINPVLLLMYYDRRYPNGDVLYNMDLLLNKYTNKLKKMVEL